RRRRARWLGAARRDQGRHRQRQQPGRRWPALPPDLAEMDALSMSLTHRATGSLMPLHFTRDLRARARRGLLAAALIASAALPFAAPALPAAAQAAPVGSMSFSPSTSNVPAVPSPTFTVDVLASATTTAVLGWQFGFTFDHTVVT